MLGSAAWCSVTFRKLSNENVGREHVQILLAESKYKQNAEPCISNITAASVHEAASDMRK
jgi:hypothetical protein